jgi:RimJ/RimL family protein N-acetyltransferase
MGCDFWPLFGLELHTPRLLLRPPTDDDFPALLEAINAGIHDPELMPFCIPWTDVEPRARERSAVQHWWAARADWTVDEWHLPLAVFCDGRAVGVQELLARQYPVLKEVETGSWLTRAAHGQGIGKEMRTAVLALAFDELGAEVARSAAFVDNPASAGVSRALGYRENGQRRQAPRGVPNVTVNYELTAEEWRRTGVARTPVQVKGLAACRDMFGAG